MKICKHEYTEFQSMQALEKENAKYNNRHKEPTAKSNKKIKGLREKTLKICSREKLFKTQGGK